MATTNLTGTPPNGTGQWNIRPNFIVFVNKRKHFKLLCATALPAMIVIVQNIINLNQDIKTFRANLLVDENVQFSVEIGKILHEIQTERGTAAFFVSTDGDTLYKDRLMSQFANTDRSVLGLSKWVPIDNVVQLNSRDEFIDFLWDFRSGLLKETVNLTDMINFYSNVNYLLESVVVISINMEVAYTYWSELIAYEMLLFSAGFAGIERALGGTYYTRGLMPLDDYVWYIENKVLADEFLAQSLWYSEFAKDMISDLYTGSSLANNIETMRAEITTNVLQNASLEMGNEWFNNMTTFINILKTVQDGLADNIKKHVRHENNALKEILATRSVQLVIAISMLPIVTVLVRSIIRVSTELKSRTADLEEKKREAEQLVEELEDERKRTEELLHQVLPKSIAKTLIEKGHVIPEAFESATIMFTDVVDFTKISSRCTPMEVIAMLNELYVTMDEKLEQFGVYKVETIGDAYMVASGLPNRNGDYHVQEIAKLSLELRNALTKMMIPHQQNETIRLRIGFNSGPCVAGVVGHKMPKYCVFGDTVNTASRMESTSLPLKIQITESSACLLSLVNGFVFSERGFIEVKGKGQMRTFWLECYQPTTTDT